MIDAEVVLAEAKRIAMVEYDAELKSRQIRAVAEAVADAVNKELRTLKYELIAEIRNEFSSGRDY